MVTDRQLTGYWGADRATHSDEQPTTPIVFKRHRIAKADFQAACA
jgi:hypothetical protein